MKYELTEETKQVFLIQMHEIINTTVCSLVKDFKSPNNESLDYCSLSKEEEEFISKIKNDPLSHSVLTKLLQGSLESAFFTLTTLIDGFSIPNPEFGKWNEVLLIDRPKTYEEDPNFMKESFHEAYDIWESMNNLNKK